MCVCVCVCVGGGGGRLLDHVVLLLVAEYFVITVLCDVVSEFIWHL